MKFLCPSCKAKYQIADEKVIGRTVKMKCRQCGHIIEINEAVIGDAGLSGAPLPMESVVPASDESSLAANHPEKGKPPPKPARSATPAAGIAAVPSPFEPRTTANRNVSSSTKQAVRPLGAPPDKARVSVVPAPRTAPLRSPSAGMPPPPRPARPAPTPATVRTAEAPVRENVSPTLRRAAPGLGIGAPGSAAVGRLPGVPETVAFSLAAGAPKPAAARQDALAGAFAKAVAAAPAQAEQADHPLAGDEWYVGVNDQPIGPIRLAEIRDRAARGEVTPECLVWRDGFEDWKPLTAFPELVAVVEEGIASFRSLRPPPRGPDLSNALQPSPLAIEQPLPFQVAAAPVATTAVSFDEEALVAAGLSKPKIPLAAWLAVAMALALGITIGLVVIKPDAPKQVVKYVEVPVAARPLGAEISPPAAAAIGQPNVEAANSETIAVGEKRNGTTARKPAANGAGDAPAPATNSDVSQGLKGLQGLQGLGAPRTGPVSEVAASAAGHQQLDSATLSRTVSRYTASVKRSCWQPALDTRAPDALTSARISANIVVAPNGKVQTVTVSPDPKGYRGLSSCIQARVRNWEFPAAGGSTEFNVPFVFAAQ